MAPGGENGPDKTGTSSVHSPSYAVVRKMSDLVGVEATELPPLYEAINPDSMDNLFHTDSEGEVWFMYNEFKVTVASDGTVTVKEPDDDS